MRDVKVSVAGRGLFPRARATENALERMCGLLPRRSLGDDEALWIHPCTSIHTFFMRFAIDAAFLDRSGQVIALYEKLPPWRHTWIHLRAAGVLEVPAGSFARMGIRKGDRLDLCVSS